MPTLITKASLSFLAKIWCAVFRAQLRPTTNDNTLSPSLAFLVARLMVGYPVNVGQIIAIEMRDKALNERDGFPFPCMIGNLCRQGKIPPNKLVDKWDEAFILTQVSKIKDFANHLFGAKSGGVGTLAVVPHVPIDMPHVDRGLEQGESSQPSTKEPPPSSFEASGTYVTISMLFIEKLMPQLIERDVLAMKKEIKNEMRKEMAILKDRMDGLEILVQDRLQGSDSVATEEFKSQLAEMRSQVAKLAEKPVLVPTMVMPNSLMQLLSQAPSTQSLDDFWGELPKSKSGKRKHKAREHDEETLVDMSREERRQQNKACKASRKYAREKEALEQRQRDAMLAGAFVAEHLSR
ncbi:hypothetical protein KY285_020320 [Solanum tuberosum]|nr:hypothetical protein KY289_020556 [Solanum tuberosum]KAH0693223.1 hypothetical protein KY285_020320 [Solanum tuberosum]